jgi:hypothetical protein
VEGIGGSQKGKGENNVIRVEAGEREWKDRKGEERGGTRGKRWLGRWRRETIIGLRERREE